MGDLDRSVLPMPDRKSMADAPLDARDAHFPPIEPLRPPAGAPERADRPARRRRLRRLERLRRPVQHADGRAAGRRAACKYNRFHTTALCAPTRAALLTGRNHHTVGMGVITELATSAPGLQLAPPERLRAAGRRRCASTATRPPSSASATRCRSGRPARWARSTPGPRGGGGFEHFYGFIGGETNQYYPAIYDGTTPVEPTEDARGGLPLHRGHDRPGDRLGPPAEGADAGQAVLRLLRARAPPTPRTTSRRSGRDRYQGRFDQGWDALREEILARQKELGVVPPDAELTARHDEIPAWDDMPDELKPVLARQMEVYAGFLEHTDHHVGRLDRRARGPRRARRHARLLHHRRQRRVGRGHGQRHVQRDVHLQRRGRARDRRVHGVARSTSSARPTAYNHYAVGWAHAMDTPYQWTKQVASHWGGTRNGTIVHWPQRLRRPRRGPLAVPPRHRRRADGARGRRAARADDRQRRRAAPDRGRQHGATRSTTPAAGRAATDAVLRDVLQPRHLPRGLDGGHPPQHAVGDRDADAAASTTTSGSSTTRTRTGRQAHDLAAEHAGQARRAPAAVADRGAQVQRAAARRPPHRAVQLRPRRPPGAGQRQLAAAVRRHGPADRERRCSTSRTSRTRSPPRSRCPSGGAEGVIIAQGGAFAGWSLYAQGRQAGATATTCSACSGSRSTARRRSPPATHQVRMEFAYDGGGLAKGGTVSLYVDGDQGRRGPRRRDRCRWSSRPTRPPTSAATPARRSATTTPARRARFTGTVSWVQIDLGEDAEDADHLITPEERLRVAMARQ